MEDLFKTLGEITKPEKESNNGSKQQAVEWLKENLHNAKDAFTQAFELEKEQIKDAFYAGAFKATTDLSMLNEGVKSQLFEQYYNETYGDKESN